MNYSKLFLFFILFIGADTLWAQNQLTSGNLNWELNKKTSNFCAKYFKLKKKLTLSLIIDEIYIEGEIYYLNYNQTQKIRFSSDTVQISEHYALKVVIPRYLNENRSEYRIIIELYRIKNAYQKIHIPGITTEEHMPYGSTICRQCIATNPEGDTLFWMKGGITIK